jgi:predicted nucleotidyltransferase
VIARREIERVATQIGIAADAESVILFGSHAKGTAHKDSDVDLLIIAPSQLPRFKRSRMLYKLFRPYPFAMDLIVYTPQEIEKGKQSPVSFVSRVLREGEVVYARGD